MDLTALQDEVVRFAAEREWEKFHDPKNLAMALASEVGEMLALLRWVPSDESDQVVHRPDLRQALQDEIGDVGILLLLLCRRADIDLSTAITGKLQRNAARYPVADSRGRPERPHGTWGAATESARPANGDAKAPRD